MLFFFATSCDNKESKIEPNPVKDNKPSSLRVADGTVLNEVTVYAISLRGNNFDMVLGWYNQTTHSEQRETYTYSLYNGIALDDEALNSPEFKEKVIAFIKQQLLNIGAKRLNSAEIAILRTMDVRAIIRYGFIVQSVENYGQLLVQPRGLFEGYPIDRGINNAFVHVTLSFKLKEAFGQNIAQQLVNAHESEENPNDIASIMDNRNNSIGINLSNWSEEILLNYARSGILWSIQKVNGIETLGQFKYNDHANPKIKEQP